MFMVLDYIFYLLGIAKYSLQEKRKRHPINLSWEGEYQPVLESLLCPGDAIFFSNDRCFVSWIVRYFTKTDISHVGLYIGGGEVLHSTLLGVRTDHLSAFFGDGRHVIPVRSPASESKAKEVSREFFEVYDGRPYPLKNVVLRALGYMVGCPWRKFRFTYLFDVALIVAFPSFIFFPSWGWLFFLVPYTIYLSAVIFFFFMRKKIIIKISDPGEGFYCLPKGFYMIRSVKKMNEQWFIDELLGGLNGKH